MYFHNFPKIDYDVNGNKETNHIQDILTRIAIRKGIRDRNSLFTKYQIEDGESPEMISDIFYGNPQYHWIILMMNKLFNRYYDWPLSYSELQAYTLDKYSDVNARHHYEIPQSSGDTTVKINIGNNNTGHPTATSISNLEYEFELNEKKKQIKILDPSYLSKFISEFKTLLYQQQ